MSELLGVSALATAIGVGKGTISKHAAAGKIPIASRDSKGNPLFDLDAVREARGSNLNPLMRREPAASASVSDGEEGQAPQSERRSPREPSALVEQQKLEKQLKNRRLLKQVADDEGLLVLRSIVEADVQTLSRRTRDGVTGQMSEKASALYAFVHERPRTEAEFRVWLSEQTGAAFDETSRAIALEDEDEFDDAGADSLEHGQPDAGPDP